MALAPRLGPRLTTATLTLGLLASACASVSDRSAGDGGLSCRALLTQTIHLVRGPSKNGHDPVSNALETMRLRSCDKQIEVVTDYLSVQGTAKNLGLDSCSELAKYGIQAAAIRLLRQDRLCRSEARRDRIDTVRLPGGGVSWNQAHSHVGSVRRVCGPLSGTGTSGDDVFLNIGRDYPDPGRFTIVLWDVGGVESKPLGSTLCVSGEVTSYEGVAQIHLRSPAAIQVYN
jgi:hypothetical protein